MDSSVVLPATDASNGFSTPSVTCVQSSSTVEADVDAGHRPCSDDRTSRETISPGLDRRGASLSPVSVGLQHLTTDCGAMTTTNGGRERRVSDRQRAAWDEMHQRMERRRLEWNSQVDRLRSDFFRLKPPTSSTGDAGQSSVVVATDRGQQRVVDVEPSGTPSTITCQQFQVVINTSSRCSLSPPKPLHS